LPSSAEELLRVSYRILFPIASNLTHLGMNLPFRG
jgi:hypothetical protein